MGKYGIRVNCIAPGYVHTELIDRLLRRQAHTERFVRSDPQRLGSGRRYCQSVRLCRQRRCRLHDREVLVIDAAGVHLATTDTKLRLKKWLKSKITHSGRSPFDFAHATLRGTGLIRVRTDSVDEPKK